MTFEMLLSLICFVSSIICYVVYKLTNEKKYFDYVDQVVGR